MIKVYYIGEDNNLMHLQCCEAVREALVVDYYIWKQIQKDCMIEYKGFYTLIYPEYDFISNEKELTNFIKLIDTYENSKTVHAKVNKFVEESVTRYMKFLETYNK